MAFSFRKIISNMGYFKTQQDEDNNETQEEMNCSKKRRHSSYEEGENTTADQIDTATEGTSSKISPTKSNIILNPIDDTNKQTSLSETKKLRLESTPKTAEPLPQAPQTNTLYFSEIFKESLESLNNLPVDDDLKTITESSDSEVSINSDIEPFLHGSARYKLCRKVSNDVENYRTSLERVHDSSSSFGSFSDIELDPEDQGRVSLILSYQMKLEKLEYVLKKFLKEFKHDIEDSKMFSGRPFLTTLPGTNVANLPKILGDITNMNNVQESDSGTWNIILDNQDTYSKELFRKQFNSVCSMMKKFNKKYLKAPTNNKGTVNENIFDTSVRLRVNKKKRERKLDDFPDLREVMHNLFTIEDDRPKMSKMMTTNFNVVSERENSKCSHCERFLQMNSSPKSIDSGLKTEQSSNSYAESIASSIADFSLDNSSITMYSESLDNILSYNSYSEESLYTNYLEKPALERIAFYMKVHKIQMTTNSNCLSFICVCCSENLNDEQGLLKHILSQHHCEKLHFAYKTEYIKKCLQTRSEIKPSTVLNPMRMYRDANKIVCFGDGAFACSLCFEMLILGESQVMKHFNSIEHMDKRSRLGELLDDNTLVDDV